MCEDCARRGALSKVNQVITSTAMPNDDPDLLRSKHSAEFKKIDKKIWVNGFINFSFEEDKKRRILQGINLWVKEFVKSHAFVQTEAKIIVAVRR